MSAYEGSKMQERDENAGKKVTFGKVNKPKPELKRDIALRALNCPICSKPMQTRIVNSVYINKSNKHVAKGKHYQYFCLVCNTDDTGWTSTQSDELSLKL